MKLKILELDTLTINKIAAGEVIERPASVVKELVENSLDAQSDQITINIHEGGKSLIEIIDNGMGMNPEDAILSIKRHTTSKITNADDLFSIYSLGFRGEALASIVSVAQVEIFSRTKENEIGTHISVEGGKLIFNKNISTPVGTRIVVKNLFYNVPVRRNFLKTISTEINHITEFVTRLALSQPDVAFSLKHNGKDILTAPKGDLLAQITAIFGEQIAKGCIALDKDEDNYKIKGFITKPEFSRKSKDYLYTFVNMRSISNKTISDATSRGYGTSIPHGRFPIIFLYLTLPAEEVDVNVHPTKREVRFSKESKVYSLIESAVRQALEKSGLEIFERTLETRFKPTTLTNIGKLKTKSDTSKRTTPTSTIAKQPKFQIIKSKEQRIDSFLPSSMTGVSDLDKTAQQKVGIKVLGIIKDTYIVAETEAGLFLSDQHAAHEKVNYERYINQLKNKRVNVQQLLAPVNIALKPSEFASFEEIRENMGLFGFEIDVFGKNEIILRSIPSIMGVSIDFTIAKDIIDIIKENVSEIKNNLQVEDLKFIKDLVSIFACRRSIKAGDKIAIEQAETLLKNLLSLKEPFTCPHGRPTIIILNEDYIEELFKRDYR
ncbi:MAG: DNA mismatch repair endonuclease MutL [Candidatus Heimdallarchaeota archaeon]|nr:DNA mismatch repair endonuclease MutL [Candidatus Heimdallarchaeota archaeon]